VSSTLRPHPLKTGRILECWYLSDKEDMRAGNLLRSLGGGPNTGRVDVSEAFDGTASACVLALLTTVFPHIVLAAY
jgi:hypothetical protein